MEMAQLEHVNPPGMHRNPAFSQAVVATGMARTIFIGGQNAVDGSGAIVGGDDIEAQAAQVARNFRRVLAAVGVTVDDVVRWNVHVVTGRPLRSAMQAFLGELGMPASPPTVTVLQVAGLAHPEFLLEVDAIAVQ